MSLVHEICQRWSQVKAAGGLSRTCRTAPQMLTSWCHVWHVNFLCARMVGELAGVRDLSCLARFQGITRFKQIRPKGGWFSWFLKCQEAQPKTGLSQSTSECQVIMFSTLFWGNGKDWWTNVWAPGQLCRVYRMTSAHIIILSTINSSQSISTGLNLYQPLSSDVNW